MEEKRKAILAIVSDLKEQDVDFKELTNLSNTAGYLVVATIFQRRDRADRATCLGSGKLEELKNLATHLEADTVIFDNDISGTQFYNLEKYLEIPVIDRRTLILEIFSQRATSNEGKLQVELARRKNELPRILGKGTVLSRQGGGGGGGGGARRGGGEQQLELDRRTIRKEIFDLEKRIEKLKEERDIRRSKRQKNNVKVVAIVGYTNSGKSTLMNTMTKAGVLEEDKLFATLDPVSRKLWIDSGKEFLLIDTVGFVKRLPHELISAFRSTLEETKYADLLLHVVDGSSDEAILQYDSCNEVLKSLEADNMPTIVVINKCDLTEPKFIPNAENVLFISAKKGQGIEGLKDKISSILFN